MQQCEGGLPQKLHFCQCIIVPKSVREYIWRLCCVKYWFCGIMREITKILVTCCKETGNNQCQILNAFGTGCLNIKFYVQVHWVGYMQHGNKVPCISWLDVSHVWDKELRDHQTIPWFTTLPCHTITCTRYDQLKMWKIYVLSQDICLLTYDKW